MKNRKSYPQTQALREDLSFTAALTGAALAGMFTMLRLWALILV